MSVSVATRVVSASTRPLCAGVALAISLMCVLLGFAASTTPATGMTGMTGMTEMVSQSGMSGMSGMNDMGETATAAALTPVAAAMTMEMGGDGGPTMVSMCEIPCVTDIGGACAIAAGSAVAALLVLFLASRRNTFLGVLARVSPVFFVRRRRRDPTPWTVLSLSRLCVLRV